MKSVSGNINVQDINKTSQRIHGIDALRAIAMLLGIVLHATIAYKTVAIPTWPHDPQFNSWIFDYTYILIHSFRMPLFFLIAGYFCRFLYNKNGEKYFISHRTKRIFIPFVFSMIFILPITVFPFLVNHYIAIYPGQWKLIFTKSFQQVFHWNGMAHLWFLYYLLIYYVAVLGIQRLKKRFFPNKQFFTNYKVLPVLLISVLLTWLFLLPGKEIFLHVDTGILPKIHFLLFYGLFFTLGWIINIRPYFFHWAINKIWLLIPLGIVLSVVIFYFDFVKSFREEQGTIVLKFLASVQILVLVFGIIGFFLRYFQTESRLWKYISDASYWMYLVHLSIVAGLQILFSYTNVPTSMRFWLILVITFSITLVTYQALVRYTVIGKYLHGSRQRIKEPPVQNLVFKA